MNFFSEKRQFTCGRWEKSGGCRGSKSKSKVEDRLTDNIFAYDTFIYPKKAKVNLMNSGLRKSTPKAGSFNRVWENIFWTLRDMNVGITNFKSSAGVFDKDVERGRWRGVFDPKFIGSQPHRKSTPKFTSPYPFHPTKTWFSPSESFRLLAPCVPRSIAENRGEY